MLIHAGHELKFEASSPLAMLLMLRVHPSRNDDVESETLHISPDVPLDEFIDSFGNRCSRIAIPAGEITIHGDHLVHDTGELDDADPTASQHDVQDLRL